MATEATSLKVLGRRFKNFFGRFHIIIFFLFIAACFAAAIINLNSTLEKNSTDKTYISPIGAGDIDSTMLQRVGELNKSESVDSLPDIDGQVRSNPFSE